ncbi:MAG: molybdopterin-dependent oxidoreductase [Candidatus Obscuribacterales bacterium]|nr:molybdopterin-dependent oxidoreductase [Candidatus Obscuribacterales bacterium]
MNLEPKQNSLALNRRSFLRMLALGAFSSALTACGKKLGASKCLIQVPPGQSLARFPEKDELILLTDRPPQLESPLFVFRQDLTPNEQFFVRWHYAGIPTEVDLKDFRLNISGHLNKELSLSMDDLKKDFEPSSLVAVLQCSGNSRRYFEPMVPGGQWQNGALGNARWTGVRLKDLLERAAVKEGALQVSFAGLDEAPLQSMPKFVKSLAFDHAMQEQILVAYEMNGKPLPMVNGFPLRLVVPGFYATYWVKSLSHINVAASQFEGFWMDKAYRIPNNNAADESPDKIAKDTVPINKLNLRSLFVRPDTSDTLKVAEEFDLEGLAFDSGSGIESVEISTDGGKNWSPAKLIPNDFGNYSWVRWKFAFTPGQSGKQRFLLRAVAKSGETQPMQANWNKSGYMRNVVESLEVTVV